MTPEAEADLQSIGDYIARESSAAARRFIARIREQIRSLKTFPGRHGKAPEADAVDVDVRQLVHGMYRILYTIDAHIVTIHAVRHAARRPLRPDELPK